LNVATNGIHHVTAIASDPQRNLDFYTGVLGLRLVKLTVNFDDPSTYHLYYGNAGGDPGTLLTFFAWPGANPGRRGTGQVGFTAFAIRPASLGYWMERLLRHGVHFAGSAPGPVERFDERVIAFSDPDGLQLELVAHPAAEALPSWEGGPVPAEHALRGFHAVTLFEEGYDRTDQLLTGTLGFRSLQQEGALYRYTAADGGPGSLVDIRVAPDFWRGVVGVGTVHHVAWRVPDDPIQQTLRQDLDQLGYNVTPVIDRQYFHSIYFREPGGILFEIATDPPGFTIDEPLAELGTHLMLPPWLEPERVQIEQALPPLQLPAPGSAD
jgi:catechol 2,3-dioxygenase-like lactoylglutathione lyase family enzyme